MATLQTSLVEVAGTSGKAATRSLGLHTVGDLLRHYPRRLAERGELTDIAALRVDEQVTVLAEVRSSRLIRNKSSRGARVEVSVTDGRGELRLTFFGSANRIAWRVAQLSPGRRGLFAGKVGRYGSQLQLTHPEYQLIDDLSDDNDSGDDFAGALIAVYPATKDLPTWTIARVIRLALDQLDPVEDPIPPEIRARRGLMDIDAALHSIHRPSSRADWHAARHRLAWDEALGIQLALAQRRAESARNPAEPRPTRDGGILGGFDERLPFVLTRGQREIGELLATELAAAHPMHRLLQGEVGSGKTVVALRAMLQVVDAGGQAALLAPTEVLAAQHARSIGGMLGELAQAGQLGGSEVGTRVVLLTGSLSTAARRQNLLDVASGTAGIVVGTHALIQRDVSFADLGLVVVDEQHRFGVEQRDALRMKAARPPHVLVMTATPIPRTVAMTVFGDLDVSTLTELPSGRAAVTTTVVPVAEKPGWLDRVWQRVREEVGAGRQAFVVCPRIGGSDVAAEDDLDDLNELDDAEAGGRAPLAVVDVHDMLQDGPLTGLRLATLHGRMPVDDRDRAMSGFAAGRVDVLVATTVVEVGVDIPNATAMVVLDADRFGVSQLHQLRGRIGRGSAGGLCLLVTESAPGTPARERLDAVAATSDGFELARLDVEQRHEGDVLGVTQSGRRSQLKLLSLLRDEELIAAAREEAVRMVAADPYLAGHPLLAAQVAASVDAERAEFLEKA
jgi:ATP-dependent DNA helicase RecG